MQQLGAILLVGGAADPFRPEDATAAPSSRVEPAELERFVVRAHASVVYGHRRDEVVHELVLMGASRELAIELVDEEIDARDARFRGRGIVELGVGASALAVVAAAYFAWGDHAHSWAVHFLYATGALGALVLAFTGVGHLAFGGRGDDHER